MNMIDFCCKQCGNPQMEENNGMLVCQYCGNRILLDDSIRETIRRGKQSTVSSSIDLRSDVDILLEKCKKDPKNARRYANLVLDIDPTNKEAIRYL